MPFLAEGTCAVRVLVGNRLLDGTVLKIDFETGTAEQMKDGKREIIKGEIGLLVDLHRLTPLISQ